MNAEAFHVRWSKEHPPVFQPDLAANGFPELEYHQDLGKVVRERGNNVEAVYRSTFGLNGYDYIMDATEELVKRNAVELIHALRTLIAFHPPYGGQGA